jgi:threonine dehydratase
MTDAERAAGVVAASAGTHAQAVAWAARKLGTTATLFMPKEAPLAKIAAVREYGGEVRLADGLLEDAFVAAHAAADETGGTFVHAFDDPAVIAGQGTIALELLRQVPKIRTVIVPIGGGGLIAGTAAGVRQLRPQARIYGVEPTESNAMRLALDAGAPVPLIPRSVADGLNAPFGGVLTTAMVRALVEDVVLVDDAVILSGLRFALERTKQVLEPAGAAGLAALLTGRIPVRAGETVCVVFSGGNVDMTRLGELLATAVPLRVA